MEGIRDKNNNTQDVLSDCDGWEDKAICSLWKPYAHIGLKLIDGIS